MRVLVVYAHPNPGSFCGAVKERVTRGLRDGGHTVEVIDLHAMGFSGVPQPGLQPVHARVADPTS